MRTAYPVMSPNAGVKLDGPEQLLSANYSVEGSQNMELFDGLLRSRLGLQKLISDALGSAVMRLDIFTTLNRTKYFMACTKTDIFELDLSNLKPLYRTPTYTTGVVQVTNGSAVIRGGRTIDLCDTDPVAWVTDQGADVVVSRETSVKNEGTSSVKFALGAAAATGLIAHHVITSIDLSAEDSIGFWFRSDTALNAGDFKILLDNTAACTSPLESIDLPAITANTWTWVNVAMADPSLCTAIVAVGLNQVVDKGAMNCYIDFIVSGDWAGQIGVSDRFRLSTVNDLAFSSQVWYTVLTVDSDTQITLTAVYTATSADAQVYTLRLIFSGGATDYWDSCEFTDNSLGRIWVATNGVDPIQYWTGSNQAATLGGSPPLCKYLLPILDRLFLAWCKVVGVNQPHQIQWSAAANAQSWPGANVEYLVDSPGEVVGLAALGNYAVGLKESAFYLGRYISADTTFDFEKRDPSHGNLSPWSVVEVEGGLYYFGDDLRFHYWDGVQDRPISDDVLPFTRNLDPDGQRYSYGIHVKSRKQVRWFVSVGDTPFTHVLVFNYGFSPAGWQIWPYDTKAQLGVPGQVELQSNLFVDDATWGPRFVDEHIGFWDDREFLANAPVIIYGGTDGYIRQADVGDDDDGTDILSIFRSTRLDYGLPTHRKRLYKIEPWLKTANGGSVTYRARRDDNTAFGITKTFSIVASGKDVTKPTAVLDVECHDVTHEFRSTDHFELIGFFTHLMKTRRRVV